LQGPLTSGPAVTPKQNYIFDIFEVSFIILSFDIFVIFFFFIGLLILLILSILPVSLAATVWVLALAVKQTEQIATIKAAESNDFFTLVFMCDFFVFLITPLVGSEN
jgi:hypothetical protein